MVAKVVTGIAFLRQELAKLFMKRAAEKSGIMTLPFKNKKLQLDIEDRVQEYVLNAQKQGVDLNTMSNQNLKYTVQLNEKPTPLVRFDNDDLRTLSADSPEGRQITEALLGKRKAEVVDMTGKKIKNPQNIMGGEEIIETEAQILARLNKGNKESLSNMRYEKAVKAEEAKAAADENYIMKVLDPEDFAEGGRAGLYRGGQAEIEPNLSDIGHGSDALMARNALLTPGSQATTSTGLNYLLGEDNDTTRVPYEHGETVLPKPKPMDEYMLKEVLSQAGANTLDTRTRDMFIKMYKKKIREKNKKADGGPARQNFGMGKRAFLKWLGSGFAGIAGLKSGLLGFGKKSAVKSVIAPATHAANEAAPAYFWNLVRKIKNLGDDVTETASIAPHQKVYKYKDYELTENVSGGYTEINKKGQDIAEDVYMSHKVDEVPLKKGKKKSTKVEEYEEYTATPDQDGKMKDIETGVPDEVVQEGTVFEDTISEFTKKADGGRIGYGLGDKVIGKGIPFLLKEIRALLKNKKKVKQAVDDIFPTGDYKYDAEMAADALVENNPKIFKNMLREDLSDNVSSEIYGAVLGPIQNNALKVSRMKRATKPTETLKGIEKTGKIDISNPGIADEFARFMKETDPKGYKDLEEKVIIESFDTKGKKGHASGGRVPMIFGGSPGLKAAIASIKAALNKGRTKKIKTLFPNYSVKEKKLLKLGEKYLPRDAATLATREIEGKAEGIQILIDRLLHDKKILKKIAENKAMDDPGLNFMMKHLEETMYPPHLKKYKNIDKDILQLETIKKNLTMKDRKLNATGGLASMLGE